MAAERSARPPHLLEKDVWVVRTLLALFSSDLCDRLVFKGGTSLSKVYGAIDRFSEDIDLTYDIRDIAEDLVERAGSVLPPNVSQEQRWSETIRQRLPVRIVEEVLPVLEAAFAGDESACVRAKEDKAFVEYKPMFQGTGYVPPRVMLEFGAKSTGEPCEDRDVACDAAAHLAEVEFPTAGVRVMCAESTWWEKATAVHVFCHQGRFRGSNHFARHWYDLAMLDASGHADRAIMDRELAAAVAKRKGVFFVEKLDGKRISYVEAVTGNLRLVPEGEALAVLQHDYASMIEDGLFLGEPPAFEDLIARCADLEARANTVHPSAT